MSLEVKGPFLLHMDGDKVVSSWALRFVQHWIEYTGRPALPFTYQGPVIRLSQEAVNFINEAKEYNPTIEWKGEVHMIDTTVNGPVKLRKLAPHEVPAPQIFRL